MVCDRCRLAVNRLLDEIGVVPVRVELGRVVLSEPLTPDRLIQFRKGLEELGFELLDTREQQLVEAIKRELIHLVRHRQEPLPTNLSSYLAEVFHQEYSVLSKLFSEQVGTTVERYFIALRIERVKELLAYDAYSLKEIADRLHYSSTAHLSAQFKKVIGMSPSAYRAKGCPDRRPLDQIG